MSRPALRKLSSQARPWWQLPDIPENVLGIWLVLGSHYLRPSRYLLYRAGFILRDESFYLYDMLHNLYHFLLFDRYYYSVSHTISVAFTSTTLVLRCAMEESCLPLLFIECLPNPTCILLECTVTTNVFRTLNLEFDCETLKDTP